MNTNNRSNRILVKQDYKTYTELEDVMQEMDNFVDAIVVEGAHDKEALEKLGITKEILLCSSRPRTDFVDYISSRHKKVVILTDYDRTGKRINKKLSSWLERAGIKVEKRYRDDDRLILGFRGMRSIESVNALKKRII
ncbi:MAG: toprim domain-containing protein [Methanophagales archaeon ANME-1-THS]|nr:MAG: toprim domain-containing protein [Methanophagales archaeon ANME-1-THS]